MKTVNTLICLALLAGITQAAHATGRDFGPGWSGDTGVYLGEIEVQTVNGFDCAQRVEFGILGSCSARVIITVNRDGTLTMVDTSDYTEGFDSPHAGNWVRSGHRSLSIKSVGFGFDPAGDEAHTQVRTGEWAFSRDRRSFSGSSMTVVYNLGKYPGRSTKHGYRQQAETDLRP